MPAKLISFDNIVMFGSGQMFYETNRNMPCLIITDRGATLTLAGTVSDSILGGGGEGGGHKTLFLTNSGFIIFKILGGGGARSSRDLNRSSLNFVKIEKTV